MWETETGDRLQGTAVCQGQCSGDGHTQGTGCGRQSQAGDRETRDWLREAETGDWVLEVAMDLGLVERETVEAQQHVVSNICSARTSCERHSKLEDKL